MKILSAFQTGFKSKATACLSSATLVLRLKSLLPIRLGSFTQENPQQVYMRLQYVILDIMRKTKHTYYGFCAFHDPRFLIMELSHFGTRAKKPTSQQARKPLTSSGTQPNGLVLSLCISTARFPCLQHWPHSGPLGYKSLL